MTLRGGIVATLEKVGREKKKVLQMFQVVALLSPVASWFRKKEDDGKWAVLNHLGDNS